MKYSIVLLLLLTMNAGTNIAQNEKREGIQFFTGSLKQAVTRAKIEKKLIFFDAYAAWCGPCKTMEKEVFTDKNVAEYFNQHFICVHIDMEKGEGPSLAKKFSSIDGYPSLLFLNSEGRVMKTILGSRSSKQLLAEARLAAN